MFKKSLTGILLVIMMSFAFSVQAQEGVSSSVDVASIGPNAVKSRISAKTLPTLVDTDLAHKKADFSRFAHGKVEALNRNHHLSKSRMQIVEQPNGFFLARYHAIDHETLVCKVCRSSSKTIPYVAVLSYKETVFEAMAQSRDACRTAQFVPVSLIPNRHIFSYKKGKWQ